ncbi:3-deoxy-7-phosphoheptulonate synthase [Nitrosomonas mobilis]|uniref:Phospho-2-dehydro-3-deoxyheptonate aldolase n=1 Tax=Nitrosomonas mobilis TaxID=51642 RepID=A0A1G5SBQ3_9PROT|nr:3-deoxy-7-phosphoheptulonate synthase [Nitrosomonas mobilis]SCZ84644.1 3-deoxy-D-arabino-heptulosonate-7-phosphate synthase, phenylalanine repressible [Nitrosomonas mobilis]HNO74257.1 3-deoxy-7-phosphoheptulonate synthase [Nitrosomonas mobilis]
MKYQTDDLRIIGMHELTPPVELHREYPLNEQATEVVFQARQACHRILRGEDDRLLVVCGPCSIHDVDAALEYASRLNHLRHELKDQLEIIMRVYFEKPRTTIGWKGLINDPDLDNSFHINKGLRLARKLLLDLNNIGVPAATEFLDLISPQYVADLISWAAIGARTTESQGHRELASGVSCPVGFKNGTFGNLNIAIDAIRAASHPHNFLSVTKAGHTAIFATRGNEDCHIILRGGQAPNYDAESVAMAMEALINAHLPPYLMVDCSHANSYKDYRRQPEVAADIARQIGQGNPAIVGIMIESHLQAGRQDIADKKLEELIYGQSITDGCIGFDATEQVLYRLAEAVTQRRQHSDNTSSASASNFVV